MATVTKYAVLGKQCKGLNLWGNLFTDQSISTLASVLNKNQTLRELDLSRNHLSDKGVHIISKVLSLDNCLLKEIDLSSNKITDKGVEYIADMLRKNNTLERLSLNDNEITDHGLRLLADALTDNKKLKQLKLEQSPHEPNPRITRTGVERILDLLKDNHTLKEIYLKGHVNKQIKSELEEDAALKTDIFLFL
jgi:Ran GTPase-activating protein (RanGAP) involved in mRNA processing and transport